MVGHEGEQQLEHDGPEAAAVTFGGCVEGGKPGEQVLVQQRAKVLLDDLRTDAVTLRVRDSAGQKTQCADEDAKMIGGGVTPSRMKAAAVEKVVQGTVATHQTLRMQVSATVGGHLHGQERVLIGGDVVERRFARRLRQQLHVAKAQQRGVVDRIEQQMAQ
jgi:hypothetical protein